MYFTSSCTNKNNKFHVVTEKEELSIFVGECVIYTILQKGPLLVPAFSEAQKHELQVSSKVEPTHIERIFVKQVLTNCYKKSKNVINLSLASQPKEIISCKIANISLEKRHIPSSSRNSAIAIANFYYDIELIYRDFLGNTHTIMHNSGYRSQRVILNTTLGSLEVELQLKCFTPEIFPRQQKYPDSSTADLLNRYPSFKPVRFRLRAYT